MVLPVNITSPMRTTNLLSTVAPVFSEIDRSAIIVLLKLMDEINYFVIKIIHLLMMVVVDSMMFLLSPIFRSTSSFF